MSLTAKVRIGPVHYLIAADRLASTGRCCRSVVEIGFECSILYRLLLLIGAPFLRIETLSQSVRSSFQFAEPEPIRVSVPSLRNMSDERKYRGITFDPARRIADASAARRSRGCRRNDRCWLLLGWLVARQHQLGGGYRELLVMISYPAPFDC